MNERSIFALLTAIVGISLIAAPITMSAWGQQAGFSIEKTTQQELTDDTPVLQYADLPQDAQNAVRHTIESSDGYYVIYGKEDWPDRFFYSDYNLPGRGIYGIVYQGQYYELNTYAGGGFAFVYWFFELPFIIYGFFLAGAARQVSRGKRSVPIAAVATIWGLGFHYLGPAFDFPVVEPMKFVDLGILTISVVLVGLIAESVRHRST